MNWKKEIKITFQMIKLFIFASVLLIIIATMFSLFSQFVFKILRHQYCKKLIITFDSKPTILTGDPNRLFICDF